MKRSNAPRRRSARAILTELSELLDDLQAFFDEEQLALIGEAFNEVQGRPQPDRVEKLKQRILKQDEFVKRIAYVGRPTNRAHMH